MASPSQLPFPAKLEMEGNVAINWKKFKRTWVNYEIASGLVKKEKELRTATFLTCIGADAADVYEGFAFEEEGDEKDIDKVLDKFDNFCVGKTNETYERYLFNTCVQLEGINIDSYVAKLRKLAKTCNYGGLEDNLIRDRIVCGIRENTIRKRLLQEDKLSLDRAIDMCRAFESTAVKIKTMAGASTSEDIAEVRKLTRKQRTSESKQKDKCKYCGTFCEKRRCPAYGKKCNNCGKLNHFASECRQTRGKHRKKRKGGRVHQVETNSLLYSDSDTDVNFITDVNAIQDKIFAQMVVVNRNQQVKFQLDSGATINLIPARYVPKELIKSQEKRLTLYDNSTFSAIGTCELELKNPKNQRRYNVHFVVVNDNFEPLLGASAIQFMHLVRVQYHNIFSVNESYNEGLSVKSVLSEFSDVFQGEGKFHDKLHLEVDKSVTPVKMPLRRVPVAIKSKLKSELERLKDLNVITPVNEPTDWVSSLVIVKKPSGDLRICIDPKPLNTALKRNHFPLPILEDLLPELGHAKMFTK